MSVCTQICDITNNTLLTGRLGLAAAKRRLSGSSVFGWKDLGCDEAD